MHISLKQTDKRRVRNVREVGVVLDELGLYNPESAIDASNPYIEAACRDSTPNNHQTGSFMAGAVRSPLCEGGGGSRSKTICVWATSKKAADCAVQGGLTKGILTEYDGRCRCRGLGIKSWWRRKFALWAFRARLFLRGVAVALRAL